MKKTRTIESARQTAGALLAEWLRSGVLPENRLDRLTADRAFIMEVVCGVVRRWRTLDWILQTRLRKTPRPDLLALLMTGVYQLLFMDRVEDYATVNETVHAARQAAGEGAARLANAVLRRVQRERADIPAELERQPPGIRWSHPDDLIRRWTAEWGETRTAELCEWNNQRPATCLRLYLSRIGMPAFLEALRAGGIDAAPHPFDPSRFAILPPGARMTELPGYAEGWFAVQDPATLVATELLAPEPGDEVLDACAAPGGKTAALAERLAGSGRVVAVEAQPERFARLQENLRRLQWPCVRSLCADTRSTDGLRRALEKERLPTTFDRILLDVPCTNTGVLRRRVDARWRFSSQRLQEMMRTQRALLDGASSLLKPNGKLVYSTCSLEPEENERLARDWLREHPAFKLADERRVFPPDTQTDGAYAALLQVGSEGSDS